MPTQTGIQKEYAPASGYFAWIPGLALLARNDGAGGLRHSSESWNPVVWHGSSSV